MQCFRKAGLSQEQQARFKGETGTRPWQSPGALLGTSTAQCAALCRVAPCHLDTPRTQVVALVNNHHVSLQPQAQRLARLLHKQAAAAGREGYCSNQT